jgi:hypothetical protein
VNIQAFASYLSAVPRRQIDGRVGTAPPQPEGSEGQRSAVVDPDRRRTEIMRLANEIVSQLTKLVSLLAHDSKAA